MCAGNMTRKSLNHDFYYFDVFILVDKMYIHIKINKKLIMLLY